MAEERPPTPEEIQTLRSRISDVSENEDGKNLSLNMAHLVLYLFHNLIIFPQLAWNHWTSVV